MSDINKTIVNSKSVLPKSQISEEAEVQHSSSLKQTFLQRINLSKYSVMIKASFLQLLFYQALATLIYAYGSTCFSSPLSLDFYSPVIVCISICAPLCGANIFPSVTLSNFLRKENKYQKYQLAIYLAAQFFGTLLGLLIGELLGNQSIPPLVLKDDSAVNQIRLLLSQMVGTIILVFFILQVSNPNTTFIDNQLSGYAFITLFIYLSRAFAFSSISTINFWITLCANFIQSSKSNSEGFKYIYLYLLGNILGVLIATYFYDKVFEPTVKFIREARRRSSESNFQNLYWEAQHDSQN